MKGKKNLAGATFDKLTTADYVKLVIICLYLFLEFIPKGDAIDYNGPQWLYLGILNLCVILYLYMGNRNNRSGYDDQFRNTVVKTPLLVYVFYFMIAGLSFFSAFNTSEFLVSYSRLVIAFIGVINILLLWQRSEKIFAYVAQIIAVIVLLKCVEAIQGFFSDVPGNGIGVAILNMKSNTGNKDVFASGILIKIPFVLYCVFTGKRIQKVINLVILTFILYTLFITNTRSAIVGVFAELLIFIVFCIYHFTQHKEGRILVRQLGLFVVPVIISVLVTQVTIDTERRIATDTVNTGFGTFTERVSSINLSDTGTSGRSNIWRAAINLFRDHPFTGTGYGNWKITSIPYERLYNNDNAISVHAHNDFLESFGETGIFGGVAYLLLFLLAPIFSLKNLFSKTIPNEKKIPLLISLIGLAAYFVDSNLNFPLERATMQLYFILFFALNISENYRLRPIEKDPQKNNGRRWLPVYIIVAALLTLPAIYYSYQNWQSMIVQNTTFDDTNADIQTHKADEVNDQFPPVPTVTMWGLPISSIKGRYLISDKKYNEAVAMLANVAKENPYLFYAEFLKGKMYFENKQYDSAYKYAIIAFNNRPRNLAYFGLLAFACANKNDSIRLKKAFTLFTKYRKDNLSAGAWNNYLYALTVMKYPIPYMLKVADTALAMFPTDSVSMNNSRAMHQMAGDKVPAQTGVVQNPPPGQPSPQQNAAQPPANANVPPTGALKDSAIFYDVFKRGNDAFMKSDFKNAIDLYEKALKINVNFYAAMENIGLSYFLMQDYGQAVKYLDMGLATKTATDGKAEYYRGIALIDMGKRDEGCQSFLISESKKYYDARRLYDLNCKGVQPNQ